MKVKFGPSGNSDNFYSEGYKSSVDMPKWLNNMGLDAYEYQCTRGINIKPETANRLGQAARENNIYVSVHAPYYINLSSIEENKRKNSIQYILRTMEIAKFLGAERIVVHSGACSKLKREKALQLAQGTLKQTIKEADNRGLENIHICPETMGKINQLGTVKEVMQLCKIDDRLIPTIDFGHIHSRSLGGLKEKEDYIKIFNSIENTLGSERLKNFHIHYSRIEFTEGGEKRHRKFEEVNYGPEFEPIAEIIYRKNLTPVIICESRGTMAEDALKLKNIYSKVAKDIEYYK